MKENRDVIKSIKDGILEKLGSENAQQSNVKLSEKEENDARNLENVITNVALGGESNSVLLIGPRGAGKTRLLNIVLDRISKNLLVEKNLLKIFLNGFLQTDDRIALKEITRQLQLGKNLDDKIFRSFAENFQFLLESLKSGNRNSKSIIFILDEFDLFCQHKNQSLLYNLFDVSQSAQTPVAVIGMTCRMDILEILEKRVKSRFSHRQIFIFPNQAFDEYIHLAKEFLILPDRRKAINKWNNSVKEVFKKPAVMSNMRRYFNVTANVRELKKLLLLVVSYLTEETSPVLSPSFVIDSVSLLSVNSKSVVLSGLSVLELCLVIAMSSLTIKYDGEAFNMHMVYDEYMKFARSRSTVQTFEYSVVTKAFEHLQAVELVKPVSSVGGKMIAHYQMLKLLIDKSQIIEVLKSYPGLPVEIQQWATSVLV